MSAPGSSAPQPPTGWSAVGAPDGRGGSGVDGQRGPATPWWALAIALIVVVAVVGAVVTLVTGSNTEETVSVESRTSTEAPDTRPPTSDEPPVTAPPDLPPPAPRPPTIEEDPDTDGLVDGAPDGATGDRGSPVPSGQIADIGDGWRVQVIDVVDDATDLVMAESYLDPPPSGSRYTQVSIRAGYYGLDDPTSTFELELFAIGRPGFDIDDSCSYEPNGFAPFVDVFTGGVTSGDLCFLTTPDDAGEFYLRARLLGEDGVYLDATAPQSPVADMPTLRGPQTGAAATPARLDPVPIGVAAEIGDDWTMTVLTAAEDITDDAVAGGSLEPPPTGERLITFDVEVTYEGDGSASGYDVLIGAIDDSNVAGGSYCGALEDELDLYDDIGRGEVLSGTLCAVIGEDDLAGMMAYATGGYDATPTFFSLTDDAAAPPRPSPSPLIYHRRHG